jgi:hypothetical protein
LKVLRSCVSERGVCNQSDVKVKGPNSKELAGVRRKGGRVTETASDIHNLQLAAKRPARGWTTEGSEFGMFKNFLFQWVQGGFLRGVKATLEWSWPLTSS